MLVPALLALLCLDGKGAGKEGTCAWWWGSSGDDLDPGLNWDDCWGND